jgi:hypothetical protein
MESNTSRSRLRELHGSGYEIAEGQPNIIGWQIRDRANHRIGVVDDLLFDEELQKVRYIIANLKDNHFDLDRRRVLIPIGIAQLHDKDDDVIVPSVSSWQLRALPTYNNKLTDYDEHEIYSVFSNASASDSIVERNWQKPQNFYEHSSYNQDNMFNSRRSGTLKDQPASTSFRRRPGDTGFSSRGASTENTRSLHETDSIAASHRNSLMSDPDNDDMRHSKEETLLSKISRVRSELDEIERDLRNSRG